MGNNPVSQAVKTMNSMLNMTGGPSGSSDKDENRLPEGEKYFGFVNVSYRFH